MISRIHGGKTYAEGNAEGERIFDFAVSYDMVIANPFFKQEAGTPYHLQKWRSS